MTFSIFAPKLSEVSVNGDSSKATLLRPNWRNAITFV